MRIKIKHIMYLIPILFAGVFVFKDIFFSSVNGRDKKSLSIDKAAASGLWYMKFSENENVVPGEISRKNYYIIFDGSGSMSGKKIVTAKEALRHFIKVIPAGANVGLSAFDQKGNFERAKLGTQRDEIIRQVNNIAAGGKTPLGEAVDTAYASLGKQARKQLGYGEYNLVIITDGMATDSSHLVKVVQQLLSDSPITVHTIGFQIGKGHVLNQPGRIYYKTASNFKELSKGLESVLAELKNFTVSEYK